MGPLSTVVLAFALPVLAQDQYPNVVTVKFPDPPGFGACVDAYGKLPPADRGAIPLEKWQDACRQGLPAERVLQRLKPPPAAISRTRPAPKARIAQASRNLRDSLGGLSGKSLASLYDGGAAHGAAQAPVAVSAGAGAHQSAQAFKTGPALDGSAPPAPAGPKSVPAIGDFGHDAGSPDAGEDRFHFMRRKCLAPDFSAVRCESQTAPLHDNSYDTPINSKAITSWLVVSQEAVTGWYLRAANYLHKDDAYARWNALNDEVSRKANSEHLSACQRIALANCVASTMLDFGENDATKGSTPAMLMDHPQGECTEYAHLDEALLKSMGLQASWKTVGAKGEWMGSHAMTDVYVPKGSGSLPEGWYRVEPQAYCGPDAPCPLQKR